jgi:hypothetical protein
MAGGTPTKEKLMEQIDGEDREEDVKRGLRLIPRLGDTRRRDTPHLC